MKNQKIGIMITKIPMEQSTIEETSESATLVLQEIKDPLIVR